MTSSVKRKAAVSPGNVIVHLLNVVVMKDNAASEEAEETHPAGETQMSAVITDLR